MNRRSFLRYATVGAAVAGAGLAGYEFDRWQNSLGAPSVSTTTITETIMGPTSTRTVTNTQTVTAGSLELELFADWHGDGAKQDDEPLIKDAILELSGLDGKQTIRPDHDGKYRTRDVVLGGGYHLSFADEFVSKNSFRFISLSNAVFKPISEGYDFVLDLAEAQISLGLVVGPLTFPFRKDTRIGDIGYHDDNYCVYNPSSNACAKDWKGGKQAYDGHKGTDYEIARGTPVLAAAPGEIVIAQYEEGKDLDPNILINHGRHYESYLLTVYCHMSRVDVTVGQKVKRGDQIGLSGPSASVSSPGPHLHFQLNLASDLLHWDGRFHKDPYRAIWDSNAVCYWTKDNDPQYAIPS
jgi:murein DD-endopeptidase MepM/ murein hydrolase activator NlpD